MDYKDKVAKLAIYIRVSTEGQAKGGYSLEVQKEYLESFDEESFCGRF